MSAFVVPAAVKPGALFTFKVPRRHPWLFLGLKKKYRMPLVQNLPETVRAILGDSVKAANGKKLTEPLAERVWNAQLQVLEMYAPGLTTRLTNEQMLPLFRAWYDASGIELGESSASSTS